MIKKVFSRANKFVLYGPPTPNSGRGLLLGYSKKYLPAEGTSFAFLVRTILKKLIAWEVLWSRASRDLSMFRLK